MRKNNDKIVIFRMTPSSSIVAALIGGCVGFLGGPALVLVPWAIIGLLIGALNATIRSTTITGATFGFFLAYVFMLAGYNGNAPLVTKLIPFTMLGLIGAVCGLILSLVGYGAMAYIRKRQRKSQA